MRLSTFTDYTNPTSIAASFRRRRFRLIQMLVDAAYQDYGHCRILDVGGTANYWSLLPNDYLTSRKVAITLVNIAHVSVPEAQTMMTSLEADACNLSLFDDGQFDLVHSNSVIEHVGGWERMVMMAKEARRIGKRLYVQTPYFWFPIEPHFITPFLHWLPLSLRVKLAQTLPLGNWPRANNVDEAMLAQTSSVLLDRAMMKSLFPDAKITYEWFGPFPKSLLAIRC